MDRGERQAHDPKVGIGGMLQNEASRRGISHAEAGEIIGVSQATFSRWVSGENPPVAEHWTAIGRFLHLPKAEVGRIASAARQGRTKRGLGDRIGAIETRLDRIERLLGELTR